MHVCVWKFVCVNACVQLCERSVKETRTPAYHFHFVLVSPLHPFSVRLVRLDWSHPGKPSGIMLGYEVLRRTLRSCADGLTGLTPPVGKESDSAGGLRFRCSYLQCPASHDVCGTSCFSPDTQVIFPFCHDLLLYVLYLFFL